MKNNYFKLIGSILIVLSMIVTVGLATIGAEAEGTTTASVQWRANVIYEADNTAPTTPDDLSDYIFGGWYTNTGTEDKPVYSPVREPELNEKYVAKWVPAEVLGIQAQISNNILEDNTETQDNNKIRFVTSIDSTAYSKIGFEIKKGDAAAEVVDTTNKVFSTLYYIDTTEASENNVEEADAGSVFCEGVSEYFKTYTITSIPDTAFNTDITVRPYWDTLDGTRVYGEKAIKTVNYGRSWYYVGEGDSVVTNSAAPVGTYSNPYATLTTAVADETKTNPKFILKTDITLDNTVNIARKMTIAGSNTAKTITYNDSGTNHMFNVAEGGNLTLDNLALSGGYNGVNVMSNGEASIMGLSSITGTGYHGVFADGAGAKININMQEGATPDTDYLTITNAAERGIHNAGGTIVAKNVKVDGSGNYGISTGNDGDTLGSVTVYNLTVTGAGKETSNPAVNSYKSVLTVIGATITDSYGIGARVTDGGTLNLYGKISIIGAKSHGIQVAHSNSEANINISWNEDGTTYSGLDENENKLVIERCGGSGVYISVGTVRAYHMEVDTSTAYGIAAYSGACGYLDDLLVKGTKGNASVYANASELHVTDADLNNSQKTGVWTYNNGSGPGIIWLTDVTINGAGADKYGVWSRGTGSIVHFVENVKILNATTPLYEHEGGTTTGTYTGTE